MRRLLFLAVFMVMGLLPAPGAAEESYKFDLSETEKKPYHFGGYLEFKPVLY